MHGQVELVEQLTPHMVRVVLAGEGLADFEPLDFTDAYINLALPRPGAPYEMPVDLDAVREQLPRDQWPARRRYTVRHWDRTRRQLTLDFVVHGDDGVAGAWAANAKPGDALQFTGPAGSYRPGPNASWHLMVGDESALPAIAASLAAVPDGVPVVVRLVCDGPADELPLDTPGVLDVLWLHRNGDTGDVDNLAQATRDLTFPSGRVQGFLHGEAEEIRRVRRHLLAERQLPKAALSASAYWRRTMTDESWREIKADWTAQMEADVA